MTLAVEGSNLLVTVSNLAVCEHVAGTAPLGVHRRRGPADDKFESLRGHLAGHARR
jgi:hypothetical protein